MNADWIYGECALAGRSRPMLLRLLEQLMRRGASPVAQKTLAEESGMANNAGAHGYLHLLSDLLRLGASEPWDPYSTPLNEEGRLVEQSDRRRRSYWRGRSPRRTP